MERPSLKKIATDGPMDPVPTNFLSSNMQPPETKGPVPSTDPDMGPSSSSRQIPHGNISEIRDRKGPGDNRAMKMSAVLTQTWRDDLKSGHLPVSLSELLVKVFCPSFQLLRCLCSCNHWEGRLKILLFSHGIKFMESLQFKKEAYF